MTSLKKITDDIFYIMPNHEFDQPCLFAIAGERKTLMIDGGVAAGLAGAFADEVRKETGRGVDFVAVTHWHWDHVFGLAGVDAPVIACKNTAAHLKRMAGYASWSDEALDARLYSGEDIPACVYHIKKTYPGDSRAGITIRQPDIVFEGALAVDLGGLVCELIPLPKVHTNDSIAIHVPERGVLFIGDSTGQNSYEQPAHYSAPAVLELFEFIRGKNASVIAESHASPASPKEFWASNGILETAADLVLSGCGDGEIFKERLRSAHGNVPQEELDEIVEFFENGLGR